jgi:single-stranded-DNA-specific exonuclease
LTKRWQVAPDAPQAFTVRLGHLPRILAQILYNRGITDPEEIERFLQPDPLLPNPLQPPKLLGLDQAVARLRQAIHQNEPIAVYGDYDVDGVTATVLLVETLAMLGADVRPYIPDRVDEGYGLNTDALAKLKEAGVRLVLTVDCGVRSVAEVAFANQIGLDIIITDHHSTTDQIPSALACIDPKQPGCPYPFKELAGVGLAFKLAQALLIVESNARAKNAPALPDASSLLDLVALGTVADLAPLVGENRALVSQGLTRLNNPLHAPMRPGVAALLNAAGTKIGAVDSTAIGFALGPRLNAAGRIEHAMAAYRLLVTRDEAEARRLAEELNEQNRERQRLTRETQERARELALAQDKQAFLLFAASPDFQAGVVGLAAARLTEEFYRPAIVVELGEKTSRGSCRSIPEFHITQALDQCADLLERHGGHAAAAGFTTRTENLETLANRLRAIAAEQLGKYDLSPTLCVDCEVALDSLTPEVFRALQRLEPCGYGNPAPVLCSRNVRVMEARPVGSEGMHLKLKLRGGNLTWDAIAFRQGCHSQWLRYNTLVNAAYTVEENEWNGMKRLQLNVRDVRPAEKS